ncbi:MAG: glucose 1-dehydrogenase [Novosphingobium sp.]|nr:glucose 1-dehydrogenase [Novosphingobium sp.]
MSEQGKVAFVTGASSGIGRATAQAFIRKGYAIAMVDRDEKAGREAEEELRPLGECMFIACDVSQDTAVEAAVAQTVSKWSRMDAAFNGAGIDGEGGMTADHAEAEFDRIVSINLKGVWLCMRHQIRQMLKQGGGTIVNCASTAGLVGTKGMVAYVAAKHGVVGLTKAAALEYARENIRVNAVCPGMINTPMWQRSISDEMTAQLLEGDPIGRLGLPGEIAEAVVWLCGPESSFANGTVMPVDGGFTAQ